jgi:hypothetical protein
MALLACLVCVVVSAETVSFDDVMPGDLPPTWTGTATGKGTPKWTITKNESAPSKPNVLKQSGEAEFPVCVKNDTNLKDGFVEVKFRPMAGKEDQAGGVVWRYRDTNNYYLCRANALEDNVVLYKVEQGKRKPLDIIGRKGGYGVKEAVAPKQWHTLRVEFSGTHCTTHFDGKKLFEVEDSTFPEAGKVGVWTKADSVTLFDDFVYEGN